MELIRIGDLARRSKVPIATIKYYVREGLIAPARKSGRTMSWYDPALVERLRAIKELQRRQFLPLDVIKKSLARNDEASDDLAAAEAIAGVLVRRGGHRRTRAEVLAGGASTVELQWLATAGLAVPGPDDVYRGDDLALLSTLGAARRAGIRADMLPFDTLNDYLAALRALVAVELRMFRAGVIRRAAPGEVTRLTTAATQLSERLVVLLRRKLLLPTLERLVAEEREGGTRTRARPQVSARAGKRRERASRPRSGRRT